ncbi:MAG: pyridoxamine 5'-phosphate oxidase family protein [Pseudomonadales bacterium]|nr:pyridoxamine 5'-phosphate oxidase family protein [Pseudomonadales bacterium]
MDVENFSVIEEEFASRIRRIVWCTFVTVDRRGRPRSRILHPIWEGHTGWVATGRHSHKALHIAGNPWVSLSYWDQQHEQVYAECQAAWADDEETRVRIWELYKATPAPLGYDPAMIWPQGPEDESYGVLKLTPWRIELSSLADMRNPTVWRNSL